MRPRERRPAGATISTMLYKVEGETVAAVTTTTTVDENLYESDLESWIETTPQILGEDLLVVGRQVQLDSGTDRIDLLALDTKGSLVVIELKRDLIGGTADLQALRYAAMLRGWSHDDLRAQAEGYWAPKGNERGTLTQEVTAFCDEDAELNWDQRIILAGRDVKPRLGSMALWLREHGIDTRVVAIEILRDADRLYVQPQVVIPSPGEERFEHVGAPGSSDRPWLVDGEQWHLQQRCSAVGRQIVVAIVELISSAAPEADGPNWAQKFYISWKLGGSNWVQLETGSPNRALLIVGGLQMSAAHAAELIGYEVFDGDASLSEKLALASSVGASDRDDVLRIIIKSPDDVRGEKGDALAKIVAAAAARFAEA